MGIVREKVEEYLGRLNSHEVSDVDGRATAKLAARIKVSPEALYPVLKRMEHDGVLFRSTHGKRTFSIRLLDPLPSRLSDPTPLAPANGAVAQVTVEEIQSVLAALEQLVGTQEENARLQAELVQAQETIRALKGQLTSIRELVELLNLEHEVLQQNP